MVYMYYIYFKIYTKYTDIAFYLSTSYYIMSVICGNKFIYGDAYTVLIVMQSRANICSPIVNMLHTYYIVFMPINFNYVEIELCF